MYYTSSEKSARLLSQVKMLAKYQIEQYVIFHNISPVRAWYI